MTVRDYYSTDAGAPVLSGQAGAMIELLDAVLVNGYGSKPGLGWSIAYQDTNKRAYRLNSAVHSGRYLRVDDSNGQYAIVNAYNAMTDVNTGSGGFPDTGTARYWRKSSSSDSVARSWAIYGDEGFAHLFLRWSAATTNTYEHHVFGDLVRMADNPGQPTVFTGSSLNNDAFVTNSNDLQRINSAGDLVRIHAVPAADGTIVEQNGRFVGHFMCGTSTGDGKLSIALAEANGVSLRASPLFLARDGGTQGATNWMMGQMPGLLAPWHRMDAALSGLIYDDLIDGGARQYRVQEIHPIAGGIKAAVLIDVTGPWR